MGKIIKPNEKIKIEILRLESGTKIIAAYKKSDDVKDHSFAEVLRRVAYAEKL